MDNKCVKKYSDTVTARRYGNTPWGMCKFINALDSFAKSTLKAAAIE